MEFNIGFFPFLPDPYNIEIQNEELTPKFVEKKQLTSTTSTNDLKIARNQSGQGPAQSPQESPSSGNTSQAIIDIYDVGKGFALAETIFLFKPSYKGLLSSFLHKCSTTQFGYNFSVEKKEGSNKDVTFKFNTIELDLPKELNSLCLALTTFPCPTYEIKPSVDELSNQISVTLESKQDSPFYLLKYIIDEEQLDTFKNWITDNKILKQFQIHQLYYRIAWIQSNSFNGIYIFPNPGSAPINKKILDETILIKTSSQIIVYIFLCIEFKT